MKPIKIPVISDQKKGSYHDTESMRTFDDEESTKFAYQILQKRFLDINNWKDHCKENSADFKLFDKSGRQQTNFPKIDSLVRIKIPGPGNPESDSYDWTKVIQITDQEQRADEQESLLLICRPTTIPAQVHNRHIAHFYSEGSTSNFRISRGSKYIKIGIYGRNETPNMNASLLGKIRNLLIGIGGIVGMSKIQWKVFADEILKF